MLACFMHYRLLEWSYREFYKVHFIIKFQYYINTFSLTAQGITNEWTRKKFVLSIHKFSEAHTAKNMVDLLRNLIEEWKLGDKIHCFVTDSARNVRKVGFN